MLPRTNLTALALVWLAACGSDPADATTGDPATQTTADDPATQASGDLPTGTLTTPTEDSGNTTNSSSTGEAGTSGEAPDEVAVMLQVEPAELELVAGEHRGLTVTATFKDAAVKDVTAEATYTPAAPLIEFAGDIVGLAGGDTTLTVGYQALTIDVPVRVHGWTPRVTLEEDVEFPTRHRGTVALSGGRVFVIGTSSDMQEMLYGYRREAGWADVVSLPQNMYLQTFTRLDDDRAMLVYSAYDSTKELWARILDAKTYTLGPEQSIAAVPSTDSLSSHTLRVASNGSAAMLDIVHSDEFSNYDMSTLRWTAADGWAVALPLPAAEFTIEPAPFNLDDAGRSLFLYGTKSKAPQHVQLVTSTPGSPWSAPTDVMVLASGETSRCELVATNTAGNGVLVFARALANVDATYQLYYARISASALVEGSLTTLGPLSQNYLLQCPSVITLTGGDSLISHFSTPDLSAQVLHVRADGGFTSTFIPEPAGQAKLVGFGDQAWLLASYAGAVSRDPAWWYIHRFDLEDGWSDPYEFLGELAYADIAAHPDGTSAAVFDGDGFQIEDHPFTLRVSTWW